MTTCSGSYKTIVSEFKKLLKSTFIPSKTVGITNPFNYISPPDLVISLILLVKKISRQYTQVLFR